jgi:hypothetical protein
MAQAQNPVQQLSLEISKIQQDLLDKQKKLEEMQKGEIDKVVSEFLTKVEAAGFDKVQVKKIVIEKLTRKHKKRS